MRATDCLVDRMIACLEDAGIEFCILRVFSKADARSNFTVTQAVELSDQQASRSRGSDAFSILLGRVYLGCVDRVAVDVAIHDLLKFVLAQYHVRLFRANAPSRPKSFSFCRPQHHASFWQQSYDLIPFHERQFHGLRNINKAIAVSTLLRHLGGSAGTVAVISPFSSTGSSGSMIPNDGNVGNVMVRQRRRHNLS